MKLFSFKKINHSKIWMDGMVGMTWGFLSSLVVGTIIGLLTINQDNGFSDFVTNVKNVLFYVCPIFIGLGMGAKAKLSPLQTLSIAIACFIIGHSLIKPNFVSGKLIFNDIKFNINTKIGNPGDVFGAFVGGMMLLYFFSLIEWKSMLDAFVVPLVGIMLGSFGFLFITYITSSVLVLLQWIIYNSANKVRWAGILLAPVIGVIMGLALSLPTSSAAIALSLSLRGDAATAAMIGTASHMISFGVLTYIGTKNTGNSFAVGIGSSMLQMQNFTRKPKLLLIPVLVSAISSLFGVIALPLAYSANSVTSGMGACALYGQIFTIVENGSSNWKAYLNVLLFQISIPIIITIVSSYLFINKFKLIKKEWLKI